MIYLILDSPNPDSDRRLAKHLISLYYTNDDDDNDDNGDEGSSTTAESRAQRAQRKKDILVNQEFLKDYIGTYVAS